MKKLITLLFILPLFMACSSDDDNNDAPKQEYTSFVVTIDDSPIFPNCVAGYKLADNTYKKIADLGDLAKGIPSKEVRIDDKSISEIHIFTDYGGRPKKFDPVYKLIQNSKNTITVERGTYATAVTDISDPLQYPQ